MPWQQVGRAVVLYGGRGRVEWGGSEYRGIRNTRCDPKKIQPIIIVLPPHQHSAWKDIYRGRMSRY